MSLTQTTAHLKSVYTSRTAFQMAIELSDGRSGTLITSLGMRSFLISHIVHGGSRLWFVAVEAVEEALVVSVIRSE